MSDPNKHHGKNLQEYLANMDEALCDKMLSIARIGICSESFKS